MNGHQLKGVQYSDYFARLLGPVDVDHKIYAVNFSISYREMTIDSTDVMTRGDRLLERYPESFSEEFTANKRAVQMLTSIESLGSRNRIAAYITRVKRTAY